MKKRASGLVLLVVLATIASACGARVSDQQLRAARSGGSSGFATGAAAGADGVQSSNTEAGGPASSSDSMVTAPTDAAGGAAAPAPGAPGGAQAAAVAPPGGNGGATDVGVTSTEVRLGNVSTLSGPVPGLFQGAVLGTQAVVAYQNSKGGLFGRKIKLDARDDQFDTGQNRAQTADLVGKVFAFVGSFSLYDDAGVGEIAKSNILDMTVYLNASRGALKNNYSVAPSIGAPTGPFLWFKAKFPEAVKAVGTIYGDVPSSKSSHMRFKAGAESVGWKFVYERGYQATETDFTADVVRMKSSGVKGVYVIAADDKTVARLAKAMAQQGFKPEFFLANYLPTLPALGGTAVENMYSDSPFSLFGDGDAGAAEVKLYNQWLNKVRPGATGDLYGLYGWAEGRLLFQAMEAAGPRATRADVARELAKIQEFSANDLVAPAGPAAKRQSLCYVIGQIRGGRYARVDPANGYRCDGTLYRP